MAELIDFRTRRTIADEPPEPSYPAAWYDVAAVRLAILRICPPPVRDALSVEAMTALARVAIRTLDQTRQARAADPTADRRSEAHDWLPGLAAAHGWGREVPSIPTPPNATREFLALQEMLRPRDLSPVASDYTVPDDCA